MEFLKKNMKRFAGSRRAFLAGIAALTGSLAILGKIPRKNEQPATARFLTRDGKLVEVSLEKVPLKKIPITKRRLVSWIWRDQKL